MSSLTPPIGRNILRLTNIRETANYTCVAASKFGIIEHTSFVKVQARPRVPTNVKNGSRLCGTGAVKASTPILQNKAYWEVKVQQSGIWSCGVSQSPCFLVGWNRKNQRGHRI